MRVKNRDAGTMGNTSSSTRAQFYFARRQFLFFAYSQYAERQALPIFDFWHEGKRVYAKQTPSPSRLHRFIRPPAFAPPRSLFLICHLFMKVAQKGKENECHLSFTRTFATRQSQWCVGSTLWLFWEYGKKRRRKKRNEKRNLWVRAIGLSFSASPYSSSFVRCPIIKFLCDGICEIFVIRHDYWIINKVKTRRTLLVPDSSRLFVVVVILVVRLILWQCLK